MERKESVLKDSLINNDSIFKSIFNNVGIGIAIVNSQGYPLKVNKTLEDLLGYREDELCKMSYPEFTHPDDIEIDNKEYEKLLAGAQQYYSLKKRYIKKNGEIIWVKLTVSLINENEHSTNLAIALVEDLTEQVGIEQKLFHEQTLLNSLLDNIPDSIYFKDLESKFIKVNKATLNKFKLASENEIIGKSDFDLFTNDHAKAAMEDEQKIISSGQPVIGVEEKETWPDGSTTWVTTTKLPLIDSDNNIIGTFGISRDITLQKEYALELKESEERYKILSSVTHEGIIIHDNGKVIDANQALLDLVGYERDEIIGKNIIEIAVHPDYYEDIYKSISSNFHEPYQVMGIKKDGSRILVELMGKQMKLNDKVFRVVSVTDITERKRNEAIQSALYKISQAVNTIDDVNDLYAKIHEIISTLMKADNFYIALYDKSTNLVSFPYFVDEFDAPPPPRKFGRGLTDYILRIKKDMLIDSKLDLQLREEGETDLEGEPCKIWMGVLLRLKEEVIGAIVLQDYENADTYGEQEKEILMFVSEQIAFAIDKKQDEEKLKRYSNELKELVASKDKFFSIVAHDLKSPFTALLGYSEMMANEYMEMSLDELKEFSMNMNEVAKKTFTLLENLLEWSRVQTGRMKFSPENIGLFQISQQVIDLYTDNAKKKGVLLKNRINPLHEVHADFNMLFTILRNLTSNAIKYTRKDDEVTLSSTSSDSFIEISVTDTGIGMKADDLPKLFRIDVHHSEIGTDEEKGTGLGLVLCRELVEKNSGRIWVKSEFGKGSQFIFTLPKIVK